ncbi:uncharacterized protein BDR25DRAFT_361467 [Lindgomyces ingoldianus]|uniref:Uncharacterized protein n=1 Tax=Lindgomyces ingoldianus TaxID=673940 RepID=A0ACB6QEU2_9PLEO|nr:uncharacterized protein BDR25DRAFT_361467 [Lindgomyces ingoldianus]KAF2464632.1 hypothetical protein BDR25DRAFT_361467 [Lindgomyces ingoldianus]
MRRGSDSATKGVDVVHGEMRCGAVWWRSRRGGLSRLGGPRHGKGPMGDSLARLIHVFAGFIGQAESPHLLAGGWMTEEKDMFTRNAVALCSLSTHSSFIHRVYLATRHLSSHTAFYRTLLNISKTLLDLKRKYQGLIMYYSLMYSLSWDSLWRELEEGNNSLQPGLSQLGVKRIGLDGALVSLTTVLPSAPPSLEGLRQASTIFPVALSYLLTCLHDKVTVFKIPAPRGFSYFLLKYSISDSLATWDLSTYTGYTLESYNGICKQMSFRSTIFGNIVKVGLKVVWAVCIFPGYVMYVFSTPVA